MVPAEILRVNLLKDGFRVTFTRPLDRATATNTDHYSTRHFELAWQAAYGTAPSHSTTVKPTSALLSEDDLSVHLKLPELLPEKLYEFRIDGLRTRTGNASTHPLAFYTLNRLLKWSRRTADQAVHISNQPSSRTWTPSLQRD